MNDNCSVAVTIYIRRIASIPFPSIRFQFFHTIQWQRLPVVVSLNPLVYESESTVNGYVHPSRRKIPSFRRTAEQQPSVVFVSCCLLHDITFHDMTGQVRILLIRVSIHLPRAICISTRRQRSEMSIRSCRLTEWQLDRDGRLVGGWTDAATANGPAASVGQPGEACVEAHHFNDSHSINTMCSSTHTIQICRWS